MLEGWDDSEKLLNLILNKVNGKKIPEMILCKRINESICSVSGGSSQFTVTVFNSHHEERSIFVRVPINQNSVKVLDDSGTVVQNQILETFKTPQLKNSEKFEVIFEVKFKGIGFITYFVTSDKRKKNYIMKKKSNEDNSMLENDQIKLMFNEKGLIQNITIKKLNETFPFKQEYSYYIGCGKDQFQPTGAYIFSPLNNTTVPFTLPINSTTILGPIINETRQQISPWVSQVVRLYKNSSFVEVQWTVGPIPKEQINPIAKELIIRYTTTIQNDGQFITDSNGRQTMCRKTNYAPDYIYNNTDPIAANYYPITNKVSISDNTNLLSILVDRAQGIGALKNGEIEIMLHRRAFQDDYEGVEEPLDELGEDGKGLIVRGIHRVYIGRKNEMTTQVRDDSVSFFKEPIIMFSNITNTSVDDYKKNFKTSYKFLEPLLPKGINLLSIESLNPTSSEWLVRLEQIYEGNEMGVKSQPIKVNFDSIFYGFKIERIIETDIQGITEKREFIKDRMLKDNKIYNNKGRRIIRKLNEEISILPMQIRTFKVYLNE
uniref:Glyco_hydro_38C domain-containing protein n=1 Tax=Parastrongyloides trichosuri TaxID=131310 RepID=A0A0N4Z636_PARTI